MSQGPDLYLSDLTERYSKKSPGRLEETEGPELRVILPTDAITVHTGERQVFRT